MTEGEPPPVPRHDDDRPGPPERRETSQVDDDLARRVEDVRREVLGRRSPFLQLGGHRAGVRDLSAAEQGDWQMGFVYDDEPDDSAEPEDEPPTEDDGPTSL
jgi:hypothetical protein